MSGLSVEGVCKSFGLVEVLRDINLTVENGEFVVLVGPSDVGKSTLLRIIAGLETLSAGQGPYRSENVTDIDPADRGVAMVFQSYALYPHMTVEQNIGFGLRMSGVSKSEVAKQVAEAAQTLELTELLQRKPRALSGGQRQRGRHRPRHRAQSGSLSVRRTLVQSRRRIARPDASRDRQAAPAAFGNDDLRHPRSGRSHDSGRPHCRVA